MAKAIYTYTPPTLPLRRTALNEVHRALEAKMSPFADWEMPINYPSGILAEHRAVRVAAGLFDVSHMGVIEVSGTGAGEFLDAVLPSGILSLAVGRAHYSVMFYPDGTLVDDLLVYRVAEERYLMVANAANAERDLDWICAVNSRGLVIDLDNPEKEPPASVTVRSLREAGEDSLVVLALQGPAALAVLLKLAGSAGDATTLRELGRNAIAPATLAGVQTLVAGTGYTGSKVGYEMFLHPDSAVELWEAILERGRAVGVIPAGLGARDSARVEAGLPLFGHELDGQLGITPGEAGYGFVIDRAKKFFIGQSRVEAGLGGRKRHLVRLAGQGHKSLRAGHIIVDRSGAAVGEVTSFAYIHEDMTFIVLALVDGSFAPRAGEAVTGARLHAGALQGPPDERSAVQLRALTRFPSDAERNSWATRYA